MGLGFNHRVQDREELAHGCRHRDFLRFSSRQQPLVESFADWVNTRGGQRGHVQHRADLRTPAAEMTRTGTLATIVVAWGDSHQRRAFALVEDASLWQCRLQGGR
jgi:hypothetical protein